MVLIFNLVLLYGIQESLFSFLEGLLVLEVMFFLEAKEVFEEQL
jgi:hypothetical protein